ncbi:fungal-specific transcription factor domain-containing protein [Ilyonectria robusta]|uniref:fungal-specific transcription factor domain-containing protein n=1 Tax=Ilyonectria robusta TaxID=1079257 RepID=UPI001E8D0A57|nr:fungal-specific transcription factor domain-containing protein [Ilyonectria robusta]KAH8669991.1 fungal-specific transcription factor domain-containing protein [Ilyonectria robusta]
MSRSRTGCFTCRRRKKKCDERKPICSSCRQNSLECNWPALPSMFAKAQRLAPAAMSAKAISRQQPSTTSLEAASSSSTDLGSTRVHSHQHHQDADSSTSSPPSTPHPCPTFSHCPSSSSSAISGASPQNDDLCKFAGTLAQYDHHRASLFNYYHSHIAPNMGNGAADVNPFIDMLVPLGLSNPLILHLLLAQSAILQQASDKRLFDNNFAQRYYADSLQLFKDMLKRHLVEKNNNLVTLTTGSLIICLTQVTRPDADGIILDHLTVAQLLLARMLADPPPELSIDLRNFMVESYIDITALNLISVHPKRGSSLVFHPEIERAARQLADEQYVGQLSGCWIELLLIILQIHQLRQGIMGNLKGQVKPTFADNIIMFGSLQTQAQCFFPASFVDQELLLASLIFKQAVLLYLWTSVDKPPSGESNSMQTMLISHAVQEAMSVLDQLPDSARVNSSLCWPLTIIGCCTRDPASQDAIKGRLKTVFESTRLGSMRQALLLLEQIWSKPKEAISPWTLHEVMQEHQVMISFM